MEMPQIESTIDEYLRKRLMPVEGAIPQLAGIDMYATLFPLEPWAGICSVHQFSATLQH